MSGRRARSASLVLAAVVLSAATARAQPVASEAARNASSSALFAQGIARYEAGQFTEAEQVFRVLLDRGHHDPEVLFNLGNAAFRRQRWAVATYALEWAHELAPGRVEIEENLELARSHLVGDPLPEQRSATARELLERARRVPLVPLAVLFLVPWTLGWALLAARWWTGRSLLAPALACLVLSGLLAVPFAYRASALHGPARGVLQDETVDVKSGPGEPYVTRFTLHAGTVVLVLDDRGDWSRIRLPAGPIGWVESSALAVLGRPETLPPLAG